jgi:predicted lysophospholipase L1 biosynthesis ABC-type transport system permease subunit
VVFVTRITSETPLHQQAALFVAVSLRVMVSTRLALLRRTAPLRIFQDDVRRLLRRAIWYVHCVGFSLVFAGLAGCYGTFGAWGLLISFASIIAGGLIVPGVAERLPRRW